MHDDLFWPRNKAGVNEMDAVWVSPRIVLYVDQAPYTVLPGPAAILRHPVTHTVCVAP